MVLRPAGAGVRPADATWRVPCQPLTVVTRLSSAAMASRKQAGEDVVVVGERLELESVSAGIEHEQRGVLARHATHAYVWRVEEDDIVGADACSEFAPFALAQVDTETRYGYLFGVER